MCSSSTGYCPGAVRSKSALGLSLLPYHYGHLALTPLQQREAGCYAKTMLTRRSPQAEANRALAEGRYDAAFAVLEGALRRPRHRLEQAQLMLQLAAVYALYGSDGLSDGLICLHEAAGIKPSITHTPLYRALHWEFAAYRGDAPDDVRAGAIAAAEAGNPLASYHAASALVAISDWGEAGQVLLRLEPQALPEYLVWRRWSLLAQSYERTGAWREAAEAYEQAASLSSSSDRQGELLNLAASWLEAGEPQEALSALANVDDQLLVDDVDRAVRCYLEGRTQLALDNPNLALELFLEAARFEEQSQEQSYGLALALAQTYAILGDYEAAFAMYPRALALAASEQRAFAAHEYAFALLEADRPLEAREALHEAAQDARYSHRADLFADLAGLEYRLGNFAEAEEHARRALALGAEAPACLTLGQIALEYYRLEEAIAWLEQAVGASREGEADWLQAQQLLCDCYVQEGYQRPEAVLRHAEAALAYLPPGDEWALTIEQYRQTALTQLGGQKRIFN